MGEKFNPLQFNKEDILVREVGEGKSILDPVGDLRGEPIGEPLDVIAAHKKRKEKESQQINELKEALEKQFENLN